MPLPGSTGQWQYPVYNALGQRVEDYQSAGASDSMKLYYPRDIFGQRMGTWDDHSSVNWVGWDVYFSYVAGQRLNMGGASAYIDHADAVGSTTMETDPSGAVDWDITRYPWGQIWQQGGTRPSGVFADLDWQINDPVEPSATREYNNNIFRWNTPDPGNAGADVSDSQSWNMYSYAGDDPITDSDPSGLYCVQASNGNWHDEGSGGETCAEAFSDKPGSVTVMSQTPETSYLTAPFINDAFIIAQQFQTARQAITSSGQLAYSGFVNLFLGNKPSGALQLGLGIASLYSGGEGEGLDALSGELGESINSLKHIARHVPEFQKLDPSIGLREVVQIGQDVISTGAKTGSRTFEKAVDVGGKSVWVKAVRNYAGRLRSVYILK